MTIPEVMKYMIETGNMHSVSINIGVGTNFPKPVIQILAARETSKPLPKGKFETKAIALEPTAFDFTSLSPAVVGTICKAYGIKVPRGDTSCSSD